MRRYWRANSATAECTGEMHREECGHISPQQAGMLGARSLLAQRSWRLGMCSNSRRCTVPLPGHAGPCTAPERRRTSNVQSLRLRYTMPTRKEWLGIIQARRGIHSEHTPA